MEKLARVNWKSLGNVIPAKRSHWTWNPASKKSSGVKFIPNPCTSKAKSLVRVKLSAGRKAKLFRATVVKPNVVHANRNTTKIKDTGACTVHAFANVTGVPFFAARNTLKLAGRADNRGFNIAGKKVAGWTLKSVLRGSQTLREFLAKHPIGKFYVQTNAHAFAVIHGKIVDNLRTAGLNRKLVNAWTITANNRE